jgi:predicted small secreted protein
MRGRRVVLCATLIVAALAGCNTVRGVGQDIERGGAAIQRGVSK